MTNTRTPEDRRQELLAERFAIREQFAEATTVSECHRLEDRIDAIDAELRRHERAVQRGRIIADAKAKREAARRALIADRDGVIG